MEFNVKEQVLKVIEDLEMGDRRPAKMDNDDFLLLLSKFNEAGFRFTSK